MKLTNNYMLREIAGEIILVPVGEMSKEVNGLITMNPMGAFIYNHVNDCKTEEDMVQLICNEYEGDIDKIRSDVHEFLQIFLNAQMITLD